MSFASEQADVQAQRRSSPVRHVRVEGLRYLYSDEACHPTVYNPRRAVANGAATTGENVFEQAFEQIQTRIRESFAERLAR